MTSFIQSVAKARTLTIGLGLLATSAPVFAQTTTEVPTTPATTTTVAPVPATDPQAKALFDQTVARYRDLKNLTVSYKNGSRNQLIQFNAPGTVKVTSLDAKGELVAVQALTDTQTIVMQKPDDVFEYISIPTDPLAEGETSRSRLATSGIGGIVFPSFLAGLDPFREGARFPASSYTLGTPTTLDGVEVTPVIVTTIKGATQTFDLTYVFFIGTQDKLVHSVEAQVKSPDVPMQKIVDNFKDYQIDTTAPADTFAFTPPAGAVKVTRFSTMRAKVGQLPIALPAGTKDIDGKEITFEQYKGKVTLVDFWATWCGPCIGELPNVKANYDKYHAQGFDVLGISLDQSTPPLAKFIKQKEMPWRQVFDGYWTGPIVTSYNVKGIPATMLIGKDGKVAAIGARGEELEPAIKAALAAG